MHVIPEIFQQREEELLNQHRLATATAAQLAEKQVNGAATNDRQINGKLPTENKSEEVIIYLQFVDILYGRLFFTDYCPTPTNEFAGFMSLGKNS